ncbi:MAG TPA: hypothetical protein VEB43_20705 [Anaeromyxobacter sp.]|nr:hypothetical protein [Anaeromyxobacter sp.]
MRRAALISLVSLLVAARTASADVSSATSPPPPAVSPSGAVEAVPAAVTTPPNPAPAPVPLPAPDAARRRWFLIPVVSYLPETGLGGGASAGLHLPVEGAPRPASLFATALYTTEGQGLLDLAADYARPGGAVLGARARAVSYPDRFYGIGPDTRSGAREKFRRRTLDLVASAEVPVLGWARLRAGPRLELRAEEIDEVAPDGALAAGGVTGADGSAGAAAGLGLTWDTREGTFWPRRGSMAQVWYVYAPAALSRTGAYGRGVLELRHFAPLPGGLVLGLHGYAEAVSGEAPFTLLPRLGSTRMLRGIREGRYRDEVGWTLQSELRAPIWRRISGVAFGAVGDVAPRIGALRLDDPKLAGGLGLRYRLTDEGANVRMDVAASRFGVQFYLLVLEAF